MVGRGAALGLALSLFAAACNPAASPEASPPGDPAACTASPEVTSAPGWDTPAATPAVIPIVVSSIQACGINRFVFTLVDAGNVPVAAPDLAVTVAFFDLGLDPATPVATVDADFVWAIEGSRGAYVANVDYPSHGTWGAEFRITTPGQPEALVRLSFTVREISPTIAVGQPAPVSKTLTLADVGGDIARLSTDREPLAAMYETSVATAVAEHRPFLLAFATPKFCASAQCGPTLDRVKPFVADYPTVTFINVEPYQLEVVDGQLQPVLTNNQLTTVAAVNEWGLVSEPWIFVVDRDGVVRGSFEGIVRTEELTAALDSVR